MAGSIGVTPNGTYTQAQHLSWLTAEDFINYPTGLGLSLTSSTYTSGTLQAICDSACSWVEKYCNRYFVQQTIDEISPDLTVNQGHVTLVDLKNYPVTSLNSVYIQVFKHFIPSSLEYLTLFQEAGYYTLIPFLTGTTNASAIPDNVLNLGETNFWTNYTFGYAVSDIPSPIYEASILVATKMIAQGENPVGASDIRIGQTNMAWRQAKDQKDPMTLQIETLLAPYKSTHFYSA